MFEKEFINNFELSEERRQKIEPRLYELRNSLEQENLNQLIEEKASELENVMRDPEFRIARLYNYFDKTFKCIPEEGAEHSKLMYAITAGVASRMGFIGGNNIKYIGYSAVLHDIGKCVLPGRLMRCIERGAYLPNDLYNLMKLHVATGYLLVEKAALEDMEDLKGISKLVLTHHEEEDGNGYIGFKGDEIPLISKIIKVIDSYLAIARKREYDPTTPHLETIMELRRCSGLDFDKDMIIESNRSKLAILKNKDIKKFGKDGINKFHERLKMMFERNTRVGKRLPNDLNTKYEEMMDSSFTPLKKLEEAYLQVRLMPENQFDSNVVEKFIEFVTLHPGSISTMLDNTILYTP